MSDIEIFLCYSHKDEPLKNELLKHLSNLKRQGVIRYWHDRRIGAGSEWANQIDEHLNTANIILLLLSSDFMASDYCNDIEVKHALKRHEAGEARVIPISLKPVDWKGAVFEKLQALPKDALPVTKWADPDEAFVNIIEGIRVAINELKIAPLLSQFLRAGNIEEKIRLGERILALDPTFHIDPDVPMRARLASLYQSRGWAKQESLVPNPNLFLGGPTGTKEDRQKVYERALPDFERAIELCPNDPEYYYYRGNLRSTSRSGSPFLPAEVFDYRGAFDDYTRAIALTPDNGRYYYARARLKNPAVGLPPSLQRKGVSKERQLEAERDFQQAVRLGYLDPETGLPRSLRDI